MGACKYKLKGTRLANASSSSSALFGPCGDGSFGILQDRRDKSLRKPGKKAPDDEKREVLGRKNEVEAEFCGRVAVLPETEGVEPDLAKFGKQGALNDFGHQENRHDHRAGHADTSTQENGRI